jgi:hypothetical protein
MRSGGARSAEQHCVAIMESATIAALIAYKRGRSGTGGKTINDVDAYLKINKPSIYPAKSSIMKKGDTLLGCLQHLELCDDVCISLGRPVSAHHSL